MRHDGSVDAGKPLLRAQVWAYEAVLQHVVVNAPVTDRPRLNHTFANATQQCALVQPAFCVVTDSESYPELATMVQENGAFDNQMEGRGQL